MMGKGHLLAGTCVLADTVAVCHIIKNNPIPFEDTLRPICDKVDHFLFESGPASISVAAWFGICVLIFWLGSILPDIDTKKSMIGHIIHIPVRHRTITHAIWIPLAFLLLAIFVHPSIFWLFYGYLWHLIFDSWSRGGLCFLWPLTQYRDIMDNGVPYKKHKVRLYRSGNMSETIVVSVICFLSGVLLWFTYDIVGMFSKLYEWVSSISSIT